MKRLNEEGTEGARGNGASGGVHIAILGAGSIAHTMATTLVSMAVDPKYAGKFTFYAIAARDANRAHEFADMYDLPAYYGSYEDLMKDPLVDLVYIATPHSFHAQQGIACLEAGKHVLVEKSFTANVSQARRLLDTADRTGLLCTEAIWTRYMPSRGMVDDLVDSGIIGEIKGTSANLCYPVVGRPRLNDPALAGGALLDLGVYPLNFIDMVLKGRRVTHMETSMQPYTTGVDAQSSTTLHFDDGTMAVATCSMLACSEHSGYIWGDDGYMICQNINNIEGIDVYDRQDRLIRHCDVPTQLTGYEYEVASAIKAIAEGRTQCPEMPHADTLRIMELMDAIRSQWGMTYPFE